MLMTSAEAAKYLRKLNEELESLRNREEQSRQFTVSLGEKEEDLRPAYDYEAARDAMLALEEKIRRVKHAVNCFNCTTEVPGFGSSARMASEISDPIHPERQISPSLYFLSSSWSVRGL